MAAAPPIASIIATELTIRFERERRALPAIALTTDTSTLTAAGNDFGFERVFARQVEALGRPGDLLIGITTSGEFAQHHRGPPRGAGTRRAHRLPHRAPRRPHRREKLADHCLVVPADRTASIQEVHILLGHFVCAAIDAAFASP